MKLNFFNFKRFNGEILITNDFGNYVFLKESEFKQLLYNKVPIESALEKRLLDSGIIYKDSYLSFSQNNELLLRYTKAYLALATSLHIFVVTTACNMNCVYCQANNGISTPHGFMTKEIAEKAVDIALQSPEHNLSFEFQGGEPLLNFPVIKYIIEYTEKNKKGHNIEYNLVSNLTLLSDEMLDFFALYHCSISTSVDGPEFLHNVNRPFNNGLGTFQSVISSVSKIRDKGLHIGAIETTTKRTLDHAKELVHTYSDIGFDSIFIRHLTQLGKANKRWEDIGYTSKEFVFFYIEAMEELIDMNKQGIFIQEQHASILLNKLHNRGINYMELRSPCGGGIGQLAYFIDGRIFTCDEGRMLAEMGNDAFLLGNVFDNDYKSLIHSNVCKTVCASSILETIPSCCDCVYQPYCGVCPVVNYAVSGDVIEKKPRSFRCEVYKGMLDYLFGILQNNDYDTIAVLDGWRE